MEKKNYVEQRSKVDNLRILKENNVQVPEFEVFEFKEGCFTERFTQFILDNVNRLSNGKFSIRSSGSVSTPGRMVTLLNVKNNMEDLLAAGLHVYGSSRTSRLRNYLKLKGIKNFEVSIIIQEMVDARASDISCSGVLTTCHPITGENTEYGEILFDSFGDGLMSGMRTPDKLTSLKERNPKGYNNLILEVEKIRTIFQNHQEIEFVIENSSAYILQTRDYKQVSKIAMDFDVDKLIAIGRSATPICAIGTATYNKDKLTSEHIYITKETDWEDVEAIVNSKGVITFHGGSLSHAAMIARDFDLPCITGITSSDGAILIEEGMRLGMDLHGGVYNMEV